jgi:hypothetical protein
VLANTTIDVNSTCNTGSTPIRWALSPQANRLDKGKLLVEKGANLFKKNDDGESAMDLPLGPQFLQHAKDLVWESVKPLLLLSKACSTNALPFNPSTAIPLPLITVFSIEGIVRDYIAPYIKRKDVITRDPSIPRPTKEPDDVKKRIEAGLAAGNSSSSSSSNKRARGEE